MVSVHVLSDLCFEFLHDICTLDLNLRPEHDTRARDLNLRRVLGIYANDLYIELVRGLDVCMGPLLGTCV